MHLADLRHSINMIDWLSWFDEICFVWCVFYVVWCEVKQEAAAAAAAADESGGQQLEREDNDMMMKYCDREFATGTH